MVRKLVPVIVALLLFAAPVLAKPQPRAIKLTSFNPQEPYYVSLVAVGVQTGFVYAPKVVTIIAGNTISVKFNTDDAGYYDGAASKARSRVTGTGDEVEDVVPLPASVPIPFTEGPYTNLYLTASGGSQTVYIICEY